MKKYKPYKIKKIAEGLSPIYDSKGNITPGTRGLGPAKFNPKDLKTIKQDIKKATPKQKGTWPQGRFNLKNLV